MQGIVFNGHYLTYLDCAVTDYWRSAAIPYEQYMNALHADMVMVQSTLQYLHPSRFEDKLSITLYCNHFGQSSLRMASTVTRHPHTIATAELIYVLVSRETQRSMQLPLQLKAAFQEFDLHGPSIQIKVGSWLELQNFSKDIRQKVFIDEQKVPEAIEWDAADDNATHVVVFNALQQAIATGRLLPSVQGITKIGRMAVIKGVRGHGIARKLLETLIEIAKARGDDQIQLSAQQHAIGLYQAAGFICVGAPYLEVDIPHINMHLQL